VRRSPSAEFDRTFATLVDVVGFIWGAEDALIGPGVEIEGLPRRRVAWRFARASYCLMCRAPAYSPSRAASRGYDHVVESEVR